MMPADTEKNFFIWFILDEKPEMDLKEVTWLAGRVKLSFFFNSSFTIFFFKFFVASKNYRAFT